MFTRFWQVGLAALAVTVAQSAWSQSVTVVEYYNTPLDAYFITGRPTEQQQLDGAPDFKRTGMSFQAVAAAVALAPNSGLTRICRFYVNTVSPFSSSHFYGREGVDCEQLRAKNLIGFAWEDYDFALAQPDSGVCPDTSTTIYRSFRAAANGKTANHRYSASAASYVVSTRAGYSGEQAAFCATSATDLTPAASYDCGTFYYPGVRVSYQSLTSEGTPNSWERFMDDQKLPFNGVQATPVVTRFQAAPSELVMISETADTWLELGTNSLGNSGTVETYFNPPTLYPRRMALGQRVSLNRTVTNAPATSFGNITQTGSTTFVGREAVDVGSGTFNSCKFSSELTARYGSSDRTDVITSTFWVAPGVGLVKSSTQETRTSGAVPITTQVSTEVTAVALKPF